MKMIATSTMGASDSEPVTAAQPMAGGSAPDKPPITIFCGVRRFSQSV